MKTLLLVWASVGIVVAQVSMKTVNTTTGTTYATFNAKVAAIGIAKYSENVNASIWPVSGKLTVPPTYDIASLWGGSYFKGVHGSAVDTLVISKMSARSMHQIFDTSVTVLCDTGSITEMHVAWFGKSELAIKRAIRAVPNGAGWPIVFSRGAVYPITSDSGIVIYERTGLNLQFNRATLKRTSGSGPVWTYKGCDMCQTHELVIDGNSIASIGYNEQSNQMNAGIGGYVGYGSSFNRNFNLYVYSCSTGVKFGQYSIDGRDDAIDRGESQGLRIDYCREGILIDSKNARDLRFSGVNITVRTSFPAAGINRSCVKVLRGDGDFTGMYTSGNGGPLFWVWRIYDGFVRVKNWYDENGHAAGAGNCGMVRCYPRVFDTSSKPNSTWGSSFTDCKLYFNGTSGDDIPDGTAIVCDSASRPLKMVNCEFGASTVANRLVRIHKNADGYSSSNCVYTSTSQPFGAWNNTSTMGKVSSLGDRLFNYTKYTTFASGDYATDTASEAGIRLYRENVEAFKDIGRTVTFSHKIDSTTDYYEGGSIGSFKSNDTVANKDFYTLIKARSNTAGVINSLKCWPSGMVSAEQARGAFKASFMFAGGTGDTSLSGARIQLVGGTSDWIRWINAGGFAEPSFTTRSVGTRLSFYQNITAASCDYAIGLGNDNDMWFSCPSTAVGYKFKWFFGTTERMRLDATTGLQFPDSTKTPCIKDANGKYWRLKVSITGAITADSTGQN